MRFVFLISAPLLWGCHQYCWATETTQLISQADVYSEPLPIKSFTDNWRGSALKDGDIAFAQGKIELRQQHGAFQYGLVWQYDYLIRFTPDTAKLYYQIKNNLPLSKTADYNLWIKANHIESKGFRLGYSYAISPDWEMNSGINLLRGMQLLQGNFSGFGQTNSLQDADHPLNSVDQLQAGIDYNYSKPILKEQTLGWYPGAPSGYGVSLDFTLHGRITPALKFDLAINNLYGRMWWKDVPNSRYSLDYQLDRLPQFNVDGQLAKKSSYAQTLPYSLDSALTFQPVAQPWSASISVYGNQLIDLWQLSSYRDVLGYKVGVHAEPQTHSYGLSLEQQYFGLKYMTDTLNTNHARRMSLGMYGKYRW